MNNIVSRNVEDGIHNFYFEDEEWVGITPSSHSWEYQEGDDDDSYISGNYVTDGNTVIDYDGSFELPTQVILALSEFGYDIDL